MNVSREFRTSDAESMAEKDSSLVDSEGPLAPIQQNGQALYDASGKEFWISVDTVTRDQGRLVAIRWSTSRALDIQFIQGDESWSVEMERHERADVAQALGLPLTATLGFSLVSDAVPGQSPVKLSITIPGGRSVQTGPLAEAAELMDSYRSLAPALNEANLAKLRTLSPGSPKWRELLESFPAAPSAPKDHLSYIEGALISPADG